MKDLNGNSNYSVHDNIANRRPVAFTASDLGKLLDKFLLYWYWFAISMVLAMLVAGGYIWYVDPAYKINAKLLIPDAAKLNNDLEPRNIQPIGFFDDISSVKAENEKEVLNSRVLMEEVVEELALQVTYYAVGLVKNREVFTRLPFQASWLQLQRIPEQVNYTLKPEGRERFILSGEGLVRNAAWGDTIRLPEGTVVLKGNRYPLAQKAYRIRISPIEKTVTDYQQRLSVSIPAKESNIIMLSLSSTIQEKGRLILNRLIAAYMRTNTENRGRIGDSTIAFINNRLGIVATELAGVEKNIQQFRQGNDLADQKEQSRLLINNRSDYMKQLNEQQMRLNVAEMLLSYVRNSRNEKRVVPSSLTMQDPVFIGLVDRYNTLQLARARQLLSNTEFNPLVANIDQQLSSLRADMENNLESQQQSIRVGMNELQQKLNSLGRDIRQIPGEERTSLDFSRQQEIKQELYLFLLKKREDIAISRASSLVDARVTDPPASENEPYKPLKWKVFLLALILGGAIPIAIIYGYELLNGRVTNKQDVTDNTPVPVLGEIGHSRAILLEMNNGSQVVEQFRVICANLLLLLPGKNEKVILLTSGMHGEGKTFVSMNLAMILALSGKKVALMEMDLRCPKISQTLGLPNDTGFTTFMEGATAYEELARPSGIHHNCWLIPSGPVPPNPSEMLLTAETARLFEKLRMEFDYIIIDAVPVNILADSQLLAKYADVTLYLVRQLHTFKRQLQLTEELYLQKKFPGLHLIVNDIRSLNRYRYNIGNYAYTESKSRAFIRYRSYSGN